MVTRSVILARLACIRHAASVRPEPGSNSPTKDSGTPEGVPVNPQRERSLRVDAASTSTLLFRYSSGSFRTRQKGPERYIHRFRGWAPRPDEVYTNRLLARCLVVKEPTEPAQARGRLHGEVRSSSIPHKAVRHKLSRNSHRPRGRGITKHNASGRRGVPVSRRTGRSAACRPGRSCRPAPPGRPPPGRPAPHPPSHRPGR